MGHPPRIPVWLSWEHRVIYFVTICVANRRRVLANETAFKAFKVAIGKVENWRVLAAMLMPDHLHVIAATQNRNAKLGNFSAALKRWMRQELKRIMDVAARLFRPSFAFRRIPSELGWSSIGKIGRTKSASTIRCKHIWNLPVFPGKRSACPTMTV